MGLELREIHKHFGSIRANDGINMHVASGSVHGLLGENGAGKSTLMKVLSGFHPADSGEIVLDGARIQLGSPGSAIAAGIGMLHQDSLLFLPMSVLDNFLLASPGSLGLGRRHAKESVTVLRDRFGFRFHLDAPVRTLTVGERQQLEITRLLWLGARVLILDEPTTGISADQRELLFHTLRELASEGMSVVFVSHKLEEVEEICDEVTVMRRGKVVGALPMPVPPEDLVTLMFGEPVALSGRTDVPLGDVVLSLHEVTFEERLTRIVGASLEAHAGEVIGLAGMEGSGQRTFLRGISGLLAPAGGTISLNGSDVTRLDYRARLDRRIQYLPAGRLEEGLVEGLTVTEHYVLTRRHDDRVLVDWDEAEAEAGAMLEHYSIRGTTASTVESLSGGNQQRLLLAMLPAELHVLLMEHPTRGLDIESAEWVWAQLLTRHEHGTAIIFASSDLDELMRYSDRILVFFAGEILADLASGATDIDQLGHLIGGRSGSAPAVVSA